jgi:hypothetical protein
MSYINIISWLQAETAGKTELRQKTHEGDQSVQHPAGKVCGRPQDHSAAEFELTDSVFLKYPA